MKLFVVLLVTLFVVRDNTVAAQDPYFIDNRLTDPQESLMRVLSEAITNVLQNMNTPNNYEIPDGEDDPSVVSNYTTPFEDEALGGSVFLYNSIIDGLSDLNDRITVEKEEQSQIRITVRMKQLIIHGDYAVDTASNTEDRGTFKASLKNVVIEGVAHLMADPNGNFIINKVVPTIVNEESQMTTKPVVSQNVPLLKAVIQQILAHIEKRLRRIAALEMVMDYPAHKNNPSVPKMNWTLFEARKYVNQRFDPYRVERMFTTNDAQRSNIGPFYLSGFSNFYLGEIIPLVGNTSVEIILNMMVDRLTGKFPYYLQDKGRGECTVEKLEFPAKIYLTPDNSVPILESLTSSQPVCKFQFTGSTPIVDIGNDVLCLMITKSIPITKIMARIQSEILNKIDMKYIKTEVYKVIQEEKLMEIAN